MGAAEADLEAVDFGLGSWWGHFSVFSSRKEMDRFGFFSLESELCVCLRLRLEGWGRGVRREEHFDGRVVYLLLYPTQ